MSFFCRLYIIIYQLHSYNCSSFHNYVFLIFIDQTIWDISVWIYKPFSEYNCSPDNCRISTHCMGQFPFRMSLLLFSLCVCILEAVPVLNHLWQCLHVHFLCHYLRNNFPAVTKITSKFISSQDSEISSLRKGHLTCMDVMIHH